MSRYLNSFSLVVALAIPLQARAGQEEDAAKRLAAHYYKGSEAERRINWLIGKIPVQLQLSLTYVGQISNIATGGLLVYKKEF